ncbi:MAG TPA: addiction module antitoxin RelB, partial [Oceanospirillaceae bacterium]|nr:addiction module antitoxin RelB [Oceanospirillaceae bacterium]
VRNGQVVLLLAGGDKDSHAKDIQKATALLEELES